MEAASMRLNPDEKCCLEELYLYYAVPTDQLRRNPVVLGRIAAAFQRLTGREEDAAELLRYMINRRKNQDWPRLGDRARRFPPAMRDLLDGEIGVLVAAYESINVPLDEYLLRADLPHRLASAFTAATQRFVAAATLVAALLAHRKRGLLPRLFEVKTAGAPQPFADIEVVARAQHRASAGG
jgi:hypothetical protein